MNLCDDVKIGYSVLSSRFQLFVSGCMGLRASPSWVQGKAPGKGLGDEVPQKRDQIDKVS